MIIIVQTLNIVMTDCYSTKSYLRGNPATLQLVLHLLPFESIALVTDGNMCQSYLPGKNVNVKLHYEDISFPASGVPITFKYAYNVEQTVVFQLSQADYDHASGPNQKQKWWSGQFQKIFYCILVSVYAFIFLHDNSQTLKLRYNPSLGANHTKLIFKNRSGQFGFFCFLQFQKFIYYYIIQQLANSVFLIYGPTSQTENEKHKT
ncbi:Conserved_hypothetical protein [Hexamita inflata]|uniref:Transmembrane protein n=1 Tax=Hexamita inflata TaxID=28002 RepID=A0ABP1HLQ0_9EUKA